MKFISIISCKLSTFFLSLVGRGSSLPGTIANILDKNILKKLELPKRIIVVTGSSGKGSTTKIIAHVLRESGFKVCHNEKGGNQKPGIITTLINASTLSGKAKSEIAVLEIDERSIKYILPIIHPTDVVITNITRDQPPRQKHINFIFEEINKGLDKNMHLYLNANDPILTKFNLDDKFNVTYYSLDKTNNSYKDNIFNSLNYPRCPKCNGVLEYKFYHFEDLGEYKCTLCDYKIPKSKYKITNFDDLHKTITLDKKYKINLNNDMLYNLFNTLAAYSVLREYDIDSSFICNSINTLNKNNKVFTKYKYHNREVFVLNNKCENATTYNQSMLYTLKDNNMKTIVIGWKEISRRYLWDDLSWLYDIEFELFNKQNIDRIIVAGPQRYDIAVRLKYAGIDENKVKIYKDLYEASDEIKDSNGNLYAILNFDYVDDFNTVMGCLK